MTIPAPGIVASFPVSCSLMDQLRLWWMRRRHIPVIGEDDEPCSYTITCSCGGHSKFWKADDGEAFISEATCPVWTFMLERQRAATRHIRRLT